MRRRILWGLAVLFLISGFSFACEGLEPALTEAPKKGTGKPAEMEELPDEEEEEAEDLPEETEEIPEEKRDNDSVPAEEEENGPKIVNYIIKKGEHHATFSFIETDLSKLTFKARFDSSAIYQTSLPDNQGDINKLYGVSDCESFHHTNSARFGWRWYREKLEIWVYTYTGGNRKFALLDTVGFDVDNEYEIEFKEDHYVFRLNEKKLEIPRSCGSKAKGYKLFPYFGGDETAPHDINILIEELKN